MIADIQINFNMVNVLEQYKSEYIIRNRYSCTMANEGLWNITTPSPRAKPEVEGGLYSIIPHGLFQNLLASETLSGVMNGNQRYM